MYIVLEGIVGSGKSTQVKQLSEFLTKKFPKKKVLTVREPWSTAIAEEIRHLAQGKEWEHEAMHPLTNAYLYASARAQTIHTVVKPALQRGDIVVSDRSFLSSLAYQGVAQGLGIETVFSLNQEALDGTIPDLILFLEIPIDHALARTFDSVWDKWEKMDPSFLEKILEGYEKASQLPFLRERFIHIDGGWDIQGVWIRIQDAVSQFFTF